MKQEYTCQLCGNKFESRNKNRKYCSIKCRGIGWSIETNIEIKCKNCDKIFYVKKTKITLNKGKFCCKNCYTEYQNKQGIGSIINAYCKVCGKGIRLTPNLIKNNVVCCSAKCRGINSIRNVIKTCKKCGKSFKTKPHLNPKFCNKECFINFIGKIEYKCENCNILFKRPNTKRYTGKKHHFCSNNCKFEWCKGKAHPKMSEWIAENISNGNFEPFAGNYYKQGYYINKSTNKEEYYASSYELKRMKQLDELGIKWTKKHNIKILYLDKNNVNHYFIPDILLTECNILEEIKPVNLLYQNNNQEKFIAAEKYCQENNLIFKVLTEKELGIKV